MVCMATMVHVIPQETIVNDGGVYVRVPLDEDRIGQPLHSAESVDRAIEEGKIPQDDVKYLQRIADKNDLNRSF